MVGIRRDEDMMNAPPAIAGPSQTTIEAVVSEIKESTDDIKLNESLKNIGGTPDMRELLLASMLSSGQDPLELLHIQDNTLGYLYILTARINVPAAENPSIEVIQQFCSGFDPVKARLAPERVTLLAKGIVTLFERSSNLDQCIPFLHDLLTRYPPSPNHLTTLHSTFARLCVSQKQFTTLLPILQEPITEIDTSISDIKYKDNLIYHYAGGMAFAALKQWTAAEGFFDIVVGSPAQLPSAIQLEALKKLALVQLILYGKVKDVPKYVPQNLVAIFKKSPYGTLVTNYPLQLEQLEKTLEKEENFFDSDKNLGLVKQVIAKARRWAIKKLTETYITLDLSDIGKEVGIEDENEVRSVIDSMVEEGEINGTISDDGTVTFEDIPITFSKTEIDGLLITAQTQDALLYEIDKKMARNRDFLNKATRKHDAQDWGDEEVFTKQSEWTEEPMF